jgi:solute carrier family 15 (peptide/histidine transporter), member 3/4
MRSACAALNLLAITLGYIVSGALNSIFSFWVTTDLNEGKLENIFLVVAALLVVNLVAFVFVSRSFKYHVPLPESTASLNISGFSPAITRAGRAVMGTYPDIL